MAGTALLLALPILVVLGFVLVPAGDVWSHLASTVLPDYVSNSLLLMLGVAIGTFVLGVSAAWVTSMCSFPGRRLFEWALLLPMAIPAYIIAYTYTGLLDFAGPVQSTIRQWGDWRYGEYWFPEVRSLEGAVIMLSLVLYPYVYLLARAAFLSQSLCVLDVSRTLGNGPWRTFFRVALPLARPAIVAGLSLALMETLADYGTVQYFGVSTFTTGIFRIWFGMDNAAAAAQLSALLLLFVFAIVFIERASRRRARYHHTSQRHRALTRFRLTGWRGWATTLYCLGILLAGTAALLALALALFLGYGKRLHGSRLVQVAVRVAGMGYAIPGTVVAVGVIIPFAAFDNRVDEWMRGHFDVSTGLLLSGTLFALLFAYLVRFLAVALQTVEAGDEGSESNREKNQVNAQVAGAV